MKKGLMFVGLFLLSFVLFGSFGVVGGEEENSDYVTETVTCKFNDIKTGEPLIEQSVCATSSHYGFFALARDKNGNIIREMGEKRTETECKTDGSCSEVEVIPQISGPALYTDSEGNIVGVAQFACQGEGNCSVTINGTVGTKIKWSGPCLEHVEGAGIKSWGELVSNPNLITIIDGTDKVVEIECVSQSFAGPIMAFMSRIWNFLFNNVDNWGVRYGYASCYDATDIRIENNLPFCVTVDNMFDTLRQRCEGKCAIDSDNCGFSMATAYNGCDLDNPERDIQSEISSTING